MNLLFDLDGTLTDPHTGIVACLQHALTVIDHPIPDTDALTALIGPPLRQGLSQLLQCPPESPLVDAAIAAYRERFAAVGLFENRLYDGIPTILDTLAARHRLFVVTSKPRIFAERIVTHFGLASYFQAVYGSELDGTRSDKGDLIAHALSQSRLAAADTVMIGDRQYDIIGALRHQVLPVGVLWGYGSRQELIQAGSHHLLQHPRELTTLERRLT
ncbi:HAD family hydrolase [Leptolyngbya sp. BL0902]|uniref:HAD hydrolase-like protein n=1 Tax=Leptolyngbya sp. BL0902 TaxID=1115757 RepID=UPI0018E7FF87|nr:HAD hydrolase-like protein [Leptolyngbya sp. BL0902]QQE65039.1 HAD family hydrolase [Leptolyngbya sp. BL0902]